jgi:hypothetical protein
MTLRLTLILIALTLAVFALSLSALPAEAGRCHSREQCQSHGWTWYGSHSKAKRKEVVRSDSLPPSHTTKLVGTGDRETKRRVAPPRKEVMRSAQTGISGRSLRATPPRKEVMPFQKRVLISLIGAAVATTAPHETQPRSVPDLTSTLGGAVVFNTAVQTRFADADDFKAVPIPRLEPQSPPEHARAVEAIVLIGLLATAIVMLVINRLRGLDSGPRVNFPFDAAHLTRKWESPHCASFIADREPWEFGDLPWLPWQVTPEWAIMRRLAGQGWARPLVEFEPT